MHDYDDMKLNRPNQSNNIRFVTSIATLDRIDAQILEALQNDGRLSNKEIAARVGLAVSSCFERLRRLRSSGILRSVHATVSPQALGIGLEAMVAVRLRRHSHAMHRNFGNHLLSIPEVVAHYKLTGSEDFLAHVMVRDTKHLYDLLLDSFTTRPEVDRIQTSLIFESVRRYAVPDLRIQASEGKRQRGKQAS
jgi:DNA-binding Lrp family transcriptional regulator